MTSEPAVKEQITLPEGVKASYQEGVVAISGPQGEVSREFLHPKVKVVIDKDDEGDEAIVITAPVNTLREKKIIRTFRAHIRNMFKGVVEGHEYKLKICSGHFPMNVSVKGSTLEVKNFFGEAVPRTYTFDSNVEVKVDGEIITVKGIDKELVAQTAASLERTTKRAGFDKKVFQDGIYIVEKDGKAV
ncbi:MAG: 50S ribosomal protein L6 [Candidatus Woesearchaeota archaeon]